MNGSAFRPVLSVIIPVYNEYTTIRAVINRVMSVTIDKEIIIVEDGSDDGTRDIIYDIVMHHAGNTLRAIFQPKNAGKGAAIRAGIREASGDFVVIQDADLEYDPRDYHILLRPCFEHDADVVYGSRFVSGEERRVLMFWHTVGNQLLTLLSNAVTDLNLTDMGTGYKLFRREVLQGMQLEQDRFGFDAEVTAKIAHRALRIFEVGISYAGRTYVEGKKTSWRDGLTAGACILRYGLSRWLHSTGDPVPATRTPGLLQMLDTTSSREALPTSH